MQVTRCDRCGGDGPMQASMLRGARLDLCEPCTDTVIGDRDGWACPPPVQGESAGGARRPTRPPVHGVTADELEPEHAARRASREGPPSTV